MVLYWEGMNNIIWSYLMDCSFIVKFWRACLMKTASMFFFCSCWYIMSTWGMIWWNRCRKNWKSSSCSILRKPDASLTVLLSNELSVAIDLKHSIRSSRFSYTVFTILLLKFHLVDEALGSLRATISSRIVVRFGDRVKKLVMPLRSEKNTLTAGIWDVACCMIKFSWCA